MAKESEEMGAKADAGDKLDAIMDMVRDTCAKFDEGVKSLTDRMDAIESDSKRRKDADEVEILGQPRAAEADRRDADLPEALKEHEFKRQDARRRDADEEKFMREDADCKDDDEAERMDAKRRDAEDEEREMRDRMDARRRDSDDYEMDAFTATQIEMADLKRQIAALSARAPSIISDSERERFAMIQEKADPVFQAFGDRAPSPLDGETPVAYKRRLGSKLQGHSQTWAGKRLSAISSEDVLDIALDAIYADSMTAARKGGDVLPGQLRMVSKQSGGHIINEFVGDSDSWMAGFTGNAQKATGNWRLPH